MSTAMRGTGRRHPFGAGPLGGTSTNTRNLAMQKLRIGAVTDIHAGRTRSNIQSDDALDLLSEVVSRANEMSLDLFVTLGDNINATSVEEDRHYLAEVRDILSGVKSPTVPMFGNNDLRYVAPSDVGEIL